MSGTAQGEPAVGDRRNPRRLLRIRRYLVRAEQISAAMVVAASTGEPGLERQLGLGGPG
jgi:hypothetical protein